MIYELPKFVTPTLQNIRSLATVTEDQTKRSLTVPHFEHEFYGASV
jgi:hypothetical protein